MQTLTQMSPMEISYFNQFDQYIQLYGYCIEGY